MDSEQLRERSRGVLAQLDGEIEVPGLRQPVEVLRDRWGVAHIYAPDQQSLFFAQGFIAAQDRLFQIDLWRRTAVGRAAEVFGPDFIERDRFARLTRFRGDLDAEWTSYAPDTKEIVTAFTDGINAYIDHVGERLPIEFELLAYRPQKWRPEDCLGRMSVLPVALNLKREVARAELIAAVGLEEARRIAPTNPPIDFAPAGGLNFTGITAEILAGYNAVTSPPMIAAGGESNNWAVDGTLSASGKPLMASDPHRSIALPSLRYLVHLNAPGWNVIGSGEPALPGVALGHNEHVAWGFTVVTTDQADLYIEQTNPANPDEYRVGNAWERMEIIREPLSVRRGDRLETIEVELRYTRHGPVIHEDRERQRAYALKWVGSEPGTAAYLSSLSLDRVKSVEEFLRESHRWKMPSENLVVADVDGHIGWIAAALTPVRNGWHGLLPVPGWSGEYRWERFLDPHDLPQTMDPDSHFVFTSNHNILPAGYPHEISYEWADEFRSGRVQQLLTEKSQFTLADFQRMQYDNVSLAARDLMEVLRDVPLDDESLGPYREMLLGWNAAQSKDSAAAALHALWWRELERSFFGIKASPALVEFASARNGPHVLLEQLQRPSADWFGADPAAARNELVRTTFARAVEEARTQLDGNPQSWQLGNVQKVLFKHPLADADARYAAAFNVGPLATGSGLHAPDQARFDDNFVRTSGATYRHVFDLADWDAGLATSAPGQSGQPESPHYADLVRQWDQGEYFPLVFSRTKVEDVTRHRLMLTPR